MNRRHFIKATVAAAVGAPAIPAVVAAAQASEPCNISGMFGCSCDCWSMPEGSTMTVSENGVAILKYIYLGGEWVKDDRVLP